MVDTEYTLYTLYIIFAVGILLTLSVQLWLCFKAKYTVIKLIPIILLFVGAIAWRIEAESLGFWDGMASAFLSACAFILLIVCAIGWGIWAIVNFIKQKKQS